MHDRQSYTKYLQVIFLLVILILPSCAGNKINTLLGHYESEELGPWDRIFLIHGGALAMGTSLELRSDSTYRYMTCGNIDIGTWTIDSNDSLSLYCTKLMKRKDTTSFEDCSTFEAIRFYWNRKDRLICCFKIDVGLAYVVLKRKED